MRSLYYKAKLFRLDIGLGPSIALRQDLLELRFPLYEPLRVIDQLVVGIRELNCDVSGMSSTPSENLHTIRSAYNSQTS